SKRFARKLQSFGVSSHPLPPPYEGRGRKALHARSRPSHSLGSASLLNLPCEGCMHDKRIPTRSDWTAIFNLISRHLERGHLARSLIAQGKERARRPRSTKNPTELRVANSPFFG